MLMAREAAESPGTGIAVGDTLVSAYPTSTGRDFDPPVSQVGQSFLPPGGVGHNSVGLYASDTSGDSGVQQPAALAAALETTLRGGSIVSIVRNGTPVDIFNCASAWPGAGGTYLVDPSDVGLSGIPANADELQASQLIPHPSVFVRQGARVRAFTRQNVHADALQLGPVVAGGLPAVQVYLVDRPPTHSTWILAADGVAVTVMVAHPEKSNLRRPVDIWNSVFNPIIAAGSQSIPTYYFDPNDRALFIQVGLFTRLSHIDWARCAGVFDSDGTTPNITPLYAPAP